MHIEELKKNLKGEVRQDEATLAHYRADASVFEMSPQAIVFPSGTEDLLSLVNVIHGQNLTGDRISLTARGKGTDLTGGSINEGIIVRFPGYLDKILEMGEDYVRVQPGLIYGELQKELAKQGRWIPVNPASGEFCSVGGMAANNSGGTKSLKYGTTRKHIKGLKIILEDGTEIDSSQELKVQSAKLKVTVENLKLLIKKNEELIKAHTPKVTKNSSGYALGDLLDTFNLTRLFVGSQGTLGIIEEITFLTSPKPSYEGVLLGYFDDLKKTGEAVTRLVNLNPSALEMVDTHIVDIIRELEPELTKSIPSPSPAVILFCEFDGSEDEVTFLIQKARPIMAEFAYQTDEATKSPKKDDLWQIRLKSAQVIEHMQGKRRPIPLEIDAAVPVLSLPSYLERVYRIFDDFGFQFAVWGHAGDANLHIRPILEIGVLKERAKLAALAKTLYEGVASFGGTASGEHGDGLLSTPFLSLTYGNDMVQLFQEVKNAFDPMGMFNPLKKVGATVDDFNTYLRKDFESYYKES